MKAAWWAVLKAVSRVDQRADELAVWSAAWWDPQKAA